jgi:uncharacterized membrane protein
MSDMSERDVKCDPDYIEYPTMKTKNKTISYNFLIMISLLIMFTSIYIEEPTTKTTIFGVLIVLSVIYVVYNLVGFRKLINESDKMKSDLKKYRLENC